jgi:class 3 adenylate cyclase/tetratricopeptide (TPR) repeat protein
MNELSSNQAEVLKQAIAALESQRSTLGDAVVEASLVALRAQLAQVEAALQRREEGRSPRLMTCLVANLITRDKDPSRGLKVLDHGFSLVAETVRLYGGTVQGVRGNYLVALFSGGADDPARAAHAALEMHQQILDFSTEREKSGHGGITFRAGLNIGTLEPGTAQPKGETGTVDIAGVLSQYAPPNTILVSQQIRTYLNDGFTFQTGAIVELGQKRIQTYRLVDARKASQIQRRGVSLEIPFLGRHNEMRTILRQIEQFSEGGVIVLTGESGLGKTRLVEEVRAAAPVIQWLDVRCNIAPVKMIYGAWVDLLLRLVGADPCSSQRNIEKALRDWLNARGIAADCYPFLANQIGLAPLDDSDPERIARQTVEAWQVLLSEVVHNRPTVIVFEEAQALDSSSLELLESLVDSFQRFPLVWILVTQPLYNQPAAATVSKLSKKLSLSRYMYLGLEPIEDDDSLALLHAVLDVDELPDPLQAGILERAKGNPLFLQHIIRALIDRRGLVADPQGHWGVTAAALQEHMPWTLRELVSQRVRSLPGDAQELLHLIAVAGDPLVPGVLKSLASAPNPGLFETLRDSGFLGKDLELCHPALREIIYQAIPKAQRAALHRQVAAALVAESELGGPWLTIRAYHMDKGAQTQGALGVYEEAKAWAYRNHALNEVSESIGAILELLNERDSPEQVASLLVEQQDVLYQLNPEDSRCKVLLERAYELWMNLGDIAEAAAVLLRMAIQHTGTTQEDAYYRDAQSLLERDNPKHPMLPSVYLRRALYAANHHAAGQGQNCDELFERARSLAKQLHDIETLAHIHFEMGLYLRNNQQLTEALAAFQQALSYFSQLDEPPPDEQILTCNYLADLYYHLGQPADGEYFAVEAVNSAPRGSDMVQVLPYITLSECCAAQARWQEAIRAVEDAPESLAPPELPPRFWLGRWQFESGDMLGGLETMREALPTQNLECMMLFIDYLLEGNFAEEASIRLHQLVKQGKFNDNSTTMPTQAFYDRLRGRLAAASKDYSRAVSLLDRAMHQFDQDSFVLLGISTRRAYITALLGRCQNGDQQAARALMDESLSLCKKLSIHAEHRRLQDTLRAHWPEQGRR